MSDHVFRYAQRAWEEPPEMDDLPDLPEIIPDLGDCPYCRKELAWDGEDDTVAWCETPGCKYDNGISEEDNRRVWEIENKCVRWEVK